MRTLLPAFSALTLLGIAQRSNAQTPLPYSTGFDNTVQQAGWQEFRTGHLSNYSWDYSSGGAPSPPNFLWHDYPVGGSATDTVQDWFVSPAFDLSAGGSLSSMKVNVFSIMGTATEVDELKVLLLSGSNDPASATAITELDDLTDLVSSSSDFIDLPALAIPATPGLSYIAFRYQATNNWFTIRIDDITITGAPEGITELSGSPLALQAFPIPATDRVHLANDTGALSGDVTIMDATGRLALRTYAERGVLDISTLTGGAYVLHLQQGPRLYRGTVIKR